MLLALIASLYAAIRDVTVQSMIARSAAGFASQMLGTEVKLKTFYVTPDLEIHVNGMQIKDLEDYPMFEIGELRIKLAISEERRLKFKDVYLNDALGNIVTYEGDNMSNLAEIISQIPENQNDKTEKSNLKLIVDYINIVNSHFVLWNQNKDDPTRKRMDYRHLDVDNINLSVSNLEIDNDTITACIKSLTANERCGLDIKSFSANVLYCPTDLVLENFLVDLNDSHIDLDIEFKYNDLDDFNRFVDSVVLISNIRDTRVKLNDIRFWSTAMNKMTDEVVLNTDFYGIINDFKLENFDLSFGECTELNGSLVIKDICKNFYSSYWIVNLPELETSYDDLVNFHIPSSSVTIPIPEKLKSVGRTSLSVDFMGKPSNFDFEMNAITEVGDVNAKLLLRLDGDLPEYVADIAVTDFDFTEIIETQDLAKITMNADIKGVGFDSKNADLNADVSVKSLIINGNTFEDFDVDIAMKDEIASVKTKIIEEFVNMELAANAKLEPEKPVIDVVAKIKDADLKKLHLVDYDSVMILSTNLDLTFEGFKLDGLVANLVIDSTKYFDGRQYYEMKHFDASITETKGVKSAEIKCDFFDFQADGIFHYASFVDAMKNTVLSHIHLPSIKKNRGLYHVEKQEFALKLDLKDTDVLTELFAPKFKIAQGTSLTATYTNGGASHGQDFECPELRIGNIVIKEIALRNSIDNEQINSELKVKDLILKDSTESSPRKINIENIVFNTVAKNDSLFFDLDWDNNKPVKRNMIDLSAKFVPNGVRGGEISLSANEFVLNDTVLYIGDSCFIDIQRDKIVVDNFNLHTKQQMLSVNGNYPKTISDTMNVEFRQLDLSDLNILFYDNDIKLGGIINGELSVSGIKERLSFTSELLLNKLLVNEKTIGDVVLDSYWNDADQSIAIGVDVVGKDVEGQESNILELAGKYYPLKKADNLDLDLNIKGMDLNSIEPLVKSVIGKMDGGLYGTVDLTGSISKPVLDGFVALKDAGCKIEFLNTYFKIDDTLHLSENLIKIDSFGLVDTLGNRAVVGGTIVHNYLKDFVLDINVKCDDFMALNIPAEKANGFYGVAVADGDVVIRGPFDDIYIGIDVETRDGTEIDIPISSQSSVDDNFIVFVKKNIDINPSDTYIPENVKTSNLTLNLDADINTSAKLNIVLPSNMGNINATGDGNVNIGLKNGNLSLKGNYLINSGLFVFTLQLVSRNFNIRKGGTINFNGNPTDADIDIVSTYRTKASLKTLGSGIDTTMVGGNVTVDCILRLQDKLMNPTITFGLEFPNSKDDVITAVFSVIDTTNQAVMAQNVLSLMLLGSFYNTGLPTLANMGSAAYYQVVTGALNNWLSMISKNFDIGVNYKPFSNFTNEEIEVALSTQLFDDRLTVEGNFGVIRGTTNTASNANNIVGDIDVTYKLNNILSLKAYNHTNTTNNSNYYSYENISDYTQGLGISVSRDFDRLGEIFVKQKRQKDKKENKKSKNQENNKDNNGYDTE